MAGILERFQKHIVGSKGRIADYTSSIAASGDFNRITDLNVILNSWRNILMTPLRSASFDPDYGSDVYKYVFAPADQDTVEAIREEVLFRLPLYDDRATIVSVDISFLHNRKGVVVDIQARYQGEVGELSATIDPNNLNLLE